MSLATYLSKLRKEAENYLKLIVESVREIYGDRVTIVLFGSRARSDYSLKSDFDVLVITETPGDVLERTVKIRKKLRGKGFAIDILIIKPEDLANPIIRQMLKAKRVLYDGLQIFKS